MDKVFDRIFGQRVGNVRVAPISIKVTLLFSILLLASNFTSNYLNFILNQEDQLSLLRLLMVRDLERTIDFASNQYEIATFQDDFSDALDRIKEYGQILLKGEKSTIMAINDKGEIAMNAIKLPNPPEIFSDETRLKEILENKERGGTTSFSYNNHTYYSVYKYSNTWDLHFIRAEERNEFLAPSREVLFNVSILIIALTAICMLIGVYSINYIFRFIRTLTTSIISMQKEQRLRLIDMTGAVNDNVTFLGLAFNSLSTTVESLVELFKKFVARDIAMKAYQQRDVKLEGEKKELAILFTDIRRFTYITETLGMDIIKLLNLHYGKVIDVIHRWHGDIGSIIGDALLAMFGTLPEAEDDRHYYALQAAFSIQQATSLLREEMASRRERIMRQRGRLNKIEESLYNALLLEVGVGLDSGSVFYGNIGSQDRMTNTVIGDHVNFSSRLEGLTRWYKVPIICSEAMVEAVNKKHQDAFYFLELDTLIVQGKTVDENIYWAMERPLVDGIMQKQCDLFSQALVHYRKGNWQKAKPLFNECELPAAEIFLARMESLKKTPKDWNGIWKMESK